MGRKLACCWLRHVTHIFTNGFVTDCHLPKRPSMAKQIKNLKHANEELHKQMTLITTLPFQDGRDLVPTYSLRTWLLAEKRAVRSSLRELTQEKSNQKLSHVFFVNVSSLIILGSREDIFDRTLVRLVCVSVLLKAPAREFYRSRQPDQTSGGVAGPSCCILKDATKQATQGPREQKG